MRVQSQERRVESQNQSFGLRSRSGSRLSTLDSRLPRGLTLIELLVVIIILTTLVSAAIPILAPTNDDRRLREASRGVNSFISGAQMKAIQLQRPFGVALKRLSVDTNMSNNPLHEDNAVCVEMFYVEQPAAYRGFDRSSSAMVARHPNRAGHVLLQFVSRGVSSANDRLPAGWDADLMPPELLRPNDMIEIDGTRHALRGPLTGWSNVSVSNQTGSIVPPATGTVVRIEALPLNDTGQMLNIEYDDEGVRMRDLTSGNVPAGPDRPYWTNPAPYKILRQPMPTSDEPFQLPEGTAIDLRASGIGRDDFFYVPGVHDNGEGILIMFAPEGRVSRVTFSALPADMIEGLNVTRFDETVVDNLFLLIGRNENAPPPIVQNDPTLDIIQLGGKTDEQLQEMKEAVNWLRGESRWIVIGAQSGRVVTTDNAFVDPQAIITKYSPPHQQSSEELRNEQIFASREFAREMTQAGGK